MRVFHAVTQVSLIHSDIKPRPLTEKMGVTWEAKESKNQRETLLKILIIVRLLHVMSQVIPEKVSIFSPFLLDLRKDSRRISILPSQTFRVIIMIAMKSDLKRFW